jgi:hypothetical protein
MVRMNDPVRSMFRACVLPLFVNNSNKIADALAAFDAQSVAVNEACAGDFRSVVHIVTCDYNKR